MDNRAFCDIQNIKDYIAKDSPRFARLTINKIINDVEILKRFPKAGKVLPELNNPEIREIVSGNFRIIYLIKDPETIHILTIHHSAKTLSL